jgi:hypothetical protein
MVQFDPQMVAQMLMQPIQRASENLGGGPFGIGADAGGSYFVDPEVAARTGYGTAVTGTSFFPGAGIVDAYGGAVDITGQPLPSFSENIREGQFTDAGLQALGVAGDIATIAAPLTGGATALLGAMMKAPRAAQKSSAIFNSVDRFPSLSKSEESLVAASSAPDEDIAGLGKVVVEKVDPNDLEGSRKRFQELKDLTANYKQDRAKARLIKLDTGEDAIQYMQPPTEVTTLNISDLTATQSDVVLGGDASLSDTMPLVVKKEGKFFIRDGHHRLAQKAISGESTAEVRLVDLDKGADVASDVAGIAKVEPPTEVSKAERQARIAANRREANIARFGYDPNDPETLPDTSYRIQHQARGPNDELPVRLDDLTKSTTGEEAGYPDDFYTSEGQRIYAQGARNANDEYGMANTESYNIIKSVKGNPDAEVTIYRGVPDEDSITDINPGDFVTLSKKYAELHAASGYGRSGNEAGKIISKKVKVKDIYWDQNDVNEFGYFPDSD